MPSQSEDTVTCDMCGTVDEVSKMYQCHDLGYVYYECADEKCKVKNPKGCQERLLEKKIENMCGTIHFKQLELVTETITMKCNYNGYIQGWLSSKLNDNKFTFAETSPIQTEILCTKMIHNTGKIDICINDKYWLHPGATTIRYIPNAQVTRYRLPRTFMSTTQVEDIYLSAFHRHNKGGIGTAQRNLLADIAKSFLMENQAVCVDAPSKYMMTEMYAHNLSLDSPPCFSSMMLVDTARASSLMKEERTIYWWNMKKPFVFVTTNPPNPTNPTNPTATTNDDIQLEICFIEDDKEDVAVPDMEMRTTVNAHTVAFAELKKKWRAFVLQHIYDHTTLLDKLSKLQLESDTVNDSTNESVIEFPKDGADMMFEITGYIKTPDPPSHDDGYASSDLSDSD